MATTSRPRWRWLPDWRCSWSPADPVRPGHAHAAWWSDGESATPPDPFVSATIPPVESGSDGRQTRAIPHPREMCRTAVIVNARTVCVQGDRDEMLSVRVVNATLR
jgi:hypothetical protein